MNTRRELYAKWQQYQNYIIIGIISFVGLFFFPMFGSEIGLAFVLPDTFAGWVVYITTKLLAAAINVLIFHCFILQAKVNIKDNPQYLAALEMLQIINKGHFPNPRSPEEYFKEVYGRKGVALFLTTIIAAVGLTQAVLVFDWIAMLSYFFAILMGIFIGILQMNATEVFWTEEFYEYALREYEKNMGVAPQRIPQSADDSAVSTGGSDVLEPTDNNSPIGDTSQS